MSYHVTRFFRNRAVTVNERNRPHDAIDWSRNRDQSAQETRARSTTPVLPVFPLTSKPAISTSSPFARIHIRACTCTCPYRYGSFSTEKALLHPTSIFSGNLLPGATLFVTITQTTCLRLTLYIRISAVRACAATCTCMSNVWMSARRRTIARKSASIKAARNPRNITAG